MKHIFRNLAIAIAVVFLLISAVDSAQKFYTFVINSTADTTPDTTDLIYLVNDPTGTPSSEHATLAYLFAAFISDTAYNATTWDAVTTIASSKNALRDKFVTIDAALDVRCLESVFGTAIGTGLLLDGTTLKTHAALQSIAGLTEADVSILETTADNTYAVVTSGGNNYILGSNSTNAALEFKTPANVLTQIGGQALDADLTNIAGADTWMMYYKNGSAVLTDLACGAANTFLRFNGASSAPTAVAVTDAVITFTDVTTGNVSTSAHGFRPKLTNVAYSYLDETGTVRAATTMPADPGADRIPMWDDGDPNAFAWISTLTGLTLTGNTLAVVYEDAAGINTGTATAEAVTADALAGSNLGSKEVAWTIHDSDTDTAVADGLQAFAVPATMSGMNLIDVTASVADLNSASGGFTTVVLRRVRAGDPQDMTSTGVTIAHDAYTESDETVNTSYDDLATGDNIYVDVNAVTTGAVHKGLSVTATFRLP